MRIATTVLSCGLLTLAAGCSSYDSKATAEQTKLESAWDGKVKPEYAETKGKDGKIYVTGTKAGADKVAAGQKLAPYRTAFGYGPNKETVVFEENKDGIMADFLEMEWKKRHPAK